ncbi:hypothetical protein [Thermococcus sp.]
MARMVEIVREAKKVEENAEKEYKKLLKKLEKPEYADLKGLVLRLAIDTIFHRHLMEALEKAHKEAAELLEKHLKDLSEEQGEMILIPGVPTIVMPLGFGPIGARVPPEELVEEFLKGMPTEIVVPEEKKIIDVIKEYLELVERMRTLYGELSKRAFHPVVRELAREIMRNEEQHEAILKGLLKKYS